MTDLPTGCALVLTIHAHGWMAGCRCGVAFRMPAGLEGEEAEVAARRLHEAHLQDGRRLGGS